jgi:hypothetical protein
VKLKLMLPLAGAATLAFAAQAQADSSGVKAGVLTCNVSSGWGFIFGSSKDLNCTFQAGSGAIEKYKGKINKYGVDIGYEQAGVMVWGVFAPGGDVSRGALAGNYGGVTASGAVGVGAGAHVLVGGSSNNISLQPVSIEGMTGLNIAAGVASITLTSEP